MGLIILGVQGLIILAEFLASDKTIKQISLIGNDIGDEGADILAGVLTNNENCKASGYW
ncbi:MULTISPECIES: hypothetical protein [unclassified Candidatus Tisiphia]|uniref:hypothetical protein n=1 Tax=unclassified Candidatus Tisiphia TaxID=2996318 RepID=UPI001E6AA889|nr:MAG: hypothetical protein LF884_00565 [Rickettsia endosymbiont of Cimex lectularius]